MAYRFLCGGLGLLLVLVGLALFADFFAFQMPGSERAMPTGPMGYYFIGFAGTGLVGWGGCLLGAARTPEGVRSVGTATAVGFVLCAVMRLSAWVVGDFYALAGDVFRVEAALFLLAALALVWLRPQPGPEART